MSHCNCSDFRQILISLSKEMLAEGDQRMKWDVFKQFLTNYKMKNEDQNFSPIPYLRFRRILCSQEICLLILNKLEEFRQRGIALSSLIVNLLAILYSEFCPRRRIHWLWNRSFSSDFETLRITGALQGLLYSSDFMKLLLNYGLFSNLPVDSPRLINVMNSEFSCFMLGIAKCSTRTDLYAVRRQVMESIKNHYCSFQDNENNKRMFLVIMALRGIQASLNMNIEESIAKEYVTCLRMYFTATRDAYLSVFEVRSFLYESFLITNRLQLFEECYQQFNKLMPECPVKMEPRKLAHLARCQIRQNLNASRLPLPSAVNKLVLPDILKSFLLGELLEIPRNEENVSSQKYLTQSELTSMISDRSAA